MLDGPLERYQRQFPQWSIHLATKGTGYTARGGGHPAWGPDLLSLALTWQIAFRTCGSFPRRPGP